jgi:hypothetical protein
MNPIRPVATGLLSLASTERPPAKRPEAVASVVEVSCTVVVRPLAKNGPPRGGGAVAKTARQPTSPSVQARAKVASGGQWAKLPQMPGF